MVSGWVFLLLVFPHLFTSASLKGMGTPTHKAGVSEPLSGDPIFRLYTLPASPSPGLSEQPLSISLAHYAPVYTFFGP